MSIPVQSRPAISEAMQVVAHPQKGSKTASPGLLLASRMRLSKARGFRGGNLSRSFRLVLYPEILLTGSRRACTLFYVNLLFMQCLIALGSAPGLSFVWVLVGSAAIVADCLSAGVYFFRRRPFPGSSVKRISTGLRTARGRCLPWWEPNRQGCAGPQSLPVRLCSVLVLPRL